MLALEVLYKCTEVVSVPLWVRDLNKSLDAMPTRRHPARMNKVIRGKGLLGFLNIHVIEVQYNESAVLKERFIFSRRKLPTETNNGESFLFLFIATSYFRYRGR